MWQVEPRLRIVDLTHEVPPFDIAMGARLIAEAAPFYALGTVFVAVVDPGVGSERRSIAIQTGSGRYYVGPDNGLFTRVIDKEGLAQAVELTDPAYFRRGAPSFTFHGRDVFAPVGARLAQGLDLRQLGRPIDGLKRLVESPARIEGEKVAGEIAFIEDPYGNVVTNIPKELAEKAGLGPGMQVSLEVGGRTLSLPFKNTFSDVPVGADLALYHSRGVLSFSVNQGDFAKRHGLVSGQKLAISRETRKP